MLVDKRVKVWYTFNAIDKESVVKVVMALFDGIAESIENLKKALNGELPEVKTPKTPFGDRVKNIVDKVFGVLRVLTLIISVLFTLAVLVVALITPFMGDFSVTSCLKMLVYMGSATLSACIYKLL